MTLSYKFRSRIQETNVIAGTTNFLKCWCPSPELLKYDDSNIFRLLFLSALTDFNIQVQILYQNLWGAVERISLKQVKNSLTMQLCFIHLKLFVESYSQSAGLSPRFSLN
jgi:hypothetical protein